MGSSSKRRRPPWASPSSPRASWATSSSSRLPEPGTEFKQGDVLGTIESVKAVSEIFAPVSGTVSEANDALTEQPETVNQDPHGAGWYCKVTLSDTSELEPLMDAAAYQEHTASESG